VLPALILAAGASTRMGRPKALLPDSEGVPFVVRVARTLLTAGLTEVVVVVAGQQEEAIREALRTSAVSSAIHVVRNPDPARGQLSSLHIGMAEVIGPHTEGVMVTLVDIPLIKVETVVSVNHAWQTHRAAITRPMVGERHGHPVIFDARLFDALRGAPLDVGAKHVVRGHASEIENVPVDDAGCLLDVDTPDEYERLQRDVLEPS
jgi:molybdenum cofactor cytidylyltransferase